VIATISAKRNGSRRSGSSNDASSAFRSGSNALSTMSVTPTAAKVVPLDGRPRTQQQFRQRLDALLRPE